MIYIQYDFVTFFSCDFCPVFLQDTVVALQALSKYGAATFSKMEKASVITVKSSETFSKEFQVHDANRLLFQEIRLPEIPGEYTTTVSGSGCVYIQVRLPGCRGCCQGEKKSQELDTNLQMEKETCPKKRDESYRRDRLLECKDK